VNINNPTTFSVPDLSLSTSNSSGSAGALRADDTILVYDTTSPVAVTSGGSASVGSAATSARRDHKHAAAAFNTDESCRVYTNATQSIADETGTIITVWGSESFDTDTMHDTDTNPGRMTIKTAGTYLVGASIGFSANATGVREVSIEKYNGIGVVATNGTGFANRTNYNTPIGCYDMDVDDYFQVFVWQNSGGSLTTLSGTQHCFWAFRIQGST
jgi:hypothetical protein